MAADRQKLIRNAERLVGRGKLNAAIENYLAVLDANPDDTTTLNRVGDLYARLQRLEEAIELFKRAAEHFSEEGFTVKAIAIYRKILRLDPLQLEASESLADLQAHQGLLQDARQQYLSVAEGYQRRQDTTSVIAVHRKLVDLEPDDPSHRLHLAELLKAEDQIHGAQDQYGAIAELLLAHGKVGDALRVCREAFDLDHGSLDFVARVVGELRRAGHETEAEQFVEFASERNPDAQRVVVEVAESAVEEQVVAEVDDETVADLAELDLEEPAIVPELVPDVVSPAVEEEEAEEVIELDLEEPEEEREIEFELEDFEPDVIEVPGAATAEAVEEPTAEIEGLRELLIEAEVLARYGLEDKAAEKFEEVIGLAPDHLDSHLQLITLCIQQEKFDRAAQLGELAAKLAESQNRQADWDQLEQQLKSADFEVIDGRITPPAIVVTEEEAVVEVAEIPAAEDLSWLDEPAAAPAAGRGDEAEIFESEAEFFDLASEIEKELDQEEGLIETDLLAAADEQSLEEIVEGFKKGMAETLSAEDFDTHYNLGIAYREMGLIDEAISEFQLAAKDHRYLVDCCSLLAACFIEKGFPELAIKWYNEGLSSPIITEEETLGLVYELGNLYLSMGENEEARLRFVEIYGVNSEYRDVGSKLAELERA